MKDPNAEQQRAADAKDVTSFIESVWPTTLPLWAAITSAPVTSVTFSPDCTLLASGSEHETIKLWDTASGKHIASLHGHKHSVNSIAFSPDGTRLASGSGGIVTKGEVKLWDTATSKELVTIMAHSDRVNNVAFSPDGTRLASSSGEPMFGSGDNTIKLWDTATGKELVTLQGHMDRVSSIAFSPDGSRLASASWDNTIKLWDATTLKEFAKLQGHTRSVTSVTFSPDGSRLASGSWDNTIKLWDTATGKEIGTLQGHIDGVNSIAFSPDGSRLASGSKDNTIKLWDTATLKELAKFQGHTSSITSVTFSSDGRCLATGSEDKTIKLWDVATLKELANASADEQANAKKFLFVLEHGLSQGKTVAGPENAAFMVPVSAPLDLASPLRAGLLALPGRELQLPEIKQTTPMLHVRQDTLAQLANPKLTPERRAELRMELCGKSSQFRAATAQWQRLLQSEWPGFEGATVPKDQAPATIPADSPIRRLYLLALIDATKHPQIHGHPTICQTAAQIAPVLTKEMMATPTISLAMMSLMQTLAKDEYPDMIVPRVALLRRLEEVAKPDWLAVLRESMQK